MSKQANVCLEINTSEFDLLDLKPASQIIELGYETTMRKLENKAIRDCFYH